MKLPSYKVSFSIEHNYHKKYYDSIEDHFEKMFLHDQPDEEEQKMIERCIAADSVWTITWYPDTPVGFCQVFAPTLEEALELAND